MPLTVALTCPPSVSKGFGITDETVDFFNKLVAQNDVVLNLFGCPYALDKFRINNSVIGLLVGYQDDDCALNAVNAILTGNKAAHGRLPVSTAKFSCGDGILPDTFPTPMPASAPVLKVGSLSIDQTPLPQGTLDAKYENQLDSIARMGIDVGAYPGCQILAMKDGKVVYDKCFGTFTYGGGYDFFLSALKSSETWGKTVIYFEKLHFSLLSADFRRAYNRW